MRVKPAGFASFTIVFLIADLSRPNNQPSDSFSPPAIRHRLIMVDGLEERPSVCGLWKVSPCSVGSKQATLLKTSTPVLAQKVNKTKIRNPKKQNQNLAPGPAWGKNTHLVSWFFVFLGRALSSRVSKAARTSLGSDGCEREKWVGERVGDRKSH